jgi:hypothetical protein
VRNLAKLKLIIGSTIVVAGTLYAVATCIASLIHGRTHGGREFELNESRFKTHVTNGWMNSNVLTTRYIGLIAPHSSNETRKQIADTFEPSISPPLSMLNEAVSRAIESEDDSDPVGRSGRRGYLLEFYVLDIGWPCRFAGFGVLRRMELPNGLSKWGTNDRALWGLVVRGGLVNEVGWWPSRHEFIVLPKITSWAGFLLSVLFWNCVCLLGIIATRWTRRKFRRSRSLCVTCGYNTIGLARCSECGCHVHRQNAWL